MAARPSRLVRGGPTVAIPWDRVEAEASSSAPPTVAQQLPSMSFSTDPRRPSLEYIERAWASAREAREGPLAPSSEQLIAKKSSIMSPWTRSSGAPWGNVSPPHSLEAGSRRPPEQSNRAWEGKSQLPLRAHLPEAQH